MGGYSLHDMPPRYSTMPDSLSLCDNTNWQSALGDACLLKSLGSLLCSACQFASMLTPSHTKSCIAALMVELVSERC